MRGTLDSQDTTPPAGTGTGTVTATATAGRPNGWRMLQPRAGGGCQSGRDRNTTPSVLLTRMPRFAPSDATDNRLLPSDDSRGDHVTN